MDAWLNIKPTAKAVLAKEMSAKKPVVIKKNTASKKKTLSKKLKKSVSLICPPELISAQKSGKIHSMLGSMNTQEIKAYCMLCKLPRSGPKYKILALLRSHVQKASFLSRHDENSDAGALVNEFSQLSFAKARTKFCKLNDSLKKEITSARQRW